MDGLLTLAFILVLGYGFIEDRRARVVSDAVPALAMVLTAMAGLGGVALFFLGLAILLNTFSFAKTRRPLMGWSDILIMPSVLAWCFAFAGVPGIFIFGLAVVFIVDVLKYSAAYTAFLLAFVLAFFYQDIALALIQFYVDWARPVLNYFSLL